MPSVCKMWRNLPNKPANLTKRIIRKYKPIFAIFINIISDEITLTGIIDNKSKILLLKN